MPPDIPWFLVLVLGAADFRVTLPWHSPRTSGLAGRGAVCCVFLTRSLTLCHTARPRCQAVRPTCLAGSGPSVPCWPLVPVSPRLHSTANSCCSTLNFHFSFTKIKNQAHNQAESSQNLRWEALPRTEARRTVFQRLIAFSECISILFFPQQWNPWVSGSLRKAGALMPEDKEPR